MYIKILSILLSYGLTGSVIVNAQGTFRNLDFELSQVPISAPDGMYRFGKPSLSILDGVRSQQPADQCALQQCDVRNGIGRPVEYLLTDLGQLCHSGKCYMPVLQAGAGGDASLAQTGVIPLGTRSLLFLTGAAPPSGGGWTVTVGSQTIPVVEVSRISPDVDYIRR